MNVIRWGNTLFLIPKGFRKLKWENTVTGQLVYIVGTNNGKPWAYGPHMVHDPVKKLLKRIDRFPKSDRLFVENSDAVLIRDIQNTGDRDD